MVDKSPNKSLDIDGLMEQCRSGDADTQVKAIRTLTEAGVKQAVPLLQTLLASDNEWVRDAAVEALGELGEGHLEEVGPALEALLTDPEEMVRNNVVETLGQLSYAPARQAIERVLLHDEYWVARASAAEALGYLGDSRALSALEAALGDELYPVRSYAAFSIGQLGNESHLPVIRRRLAIEDHPMPRADLLEVALRWGDESAFDDLLALIREADDAEFARDVLRVVNHLLSEQTPAMVLRRAVDLDHHLARLAQQTGIDTDYPDQLRGRLADLARTATPDQE